LGGDWRVCVPQRRKIAAFGGVFVTWYGLNFSAEFFVQVCLYGFVILLVLNALNPLKFARRYAITKYKLSKQHKSIRFGVWASLALVAFVVVIFGFPEGAADNSSPKSKLQLFLESSPSAVGDTLAGVAGALAFLWIIITVRLQSSELAKQREELRLTREVMGEQREAARDMANSIAEQNFDNFVFELISTHNSIVSSMDIKSKNSAKILHQGRDCFRHFYKKVSAVPDEDKMYPTMANDKTIERYEKMYEDHHSDLGHYFRFSYNMLRAVDTSGSVKAKHRKLIRALFSDEELLVIFYNAQTDLGKDFITYIEKFELFDNLPVQRLVKPEHKKWVSDKCYGALE
jgi:Putative phage abortive infection protein